MLAQARAQIAARPGTMACVRPAAFSRALPAAPRAITLQRPNASRPRRGLVVLNVKTESQDLELGFSAPDFTLLEPLTGRSVSLHQHAAGSKATLLMFICNHCPFVVSLKPTITQLTKEYQEQGVAVVAVSSNSVETHPQDGPEAMAVDAKAQGYTFPYLHDATQEVAKQYKAACTPEFLVFDSALKLVYHGQFDDSRPSKYGGSAPPSGEDVRHALDCALEGRPYDRKVKPSIGCNIKWTPGNNPPWFHG